MKHFLFVLLMLAVLSPVSAQSDDSGNWGVGLRLGDPSGITLKKYSSGYALEFSLGRTYIWYGNGWYNNYFGKWYNNQNFSYSEFDYLGYRTTFPLALQVHYLFQKPIDVSKGTFEWYYGAGAQVRFQTISYDYRYKISSDPNWYYEYNDRYTNLDLGLDVVVGLEYTFESVPVSFFVDTGIFMEVIDQPFFFWGIGGFGARYNF